MEMKEYTEIERKSLNWMFEGDNEKKWHDDDDGYFYLDVDEKEVPEFVVRYFKVRNDSNDVLDEVDRMDGYGPTRIFK